MYPYNSEIKDEYKMSSCSPGPGPDPLVLRSHSALMIFFIFWSGHLECQAYEGHVGQAGHEAHWGQRAHRSITPVVYIMGSLLRVRISSIIQNERVLVNKYVTSVQKYNEI